IQAGARIAVTCGRAERLQRDHQAGSRNLALVDGIANSHRLISAAHITSAGEALLQHLADKYLSIERPVDVRVSYPILRTVGTVREHCGDMHMAVDEARQDGRVGQIDDLHTRGRLEAVFYRNDPVIVDRDRYLLPRRSRDPVDQGTRMDDHV